jgi:hypothetical protein
MNEKLRKKSPNSKKSSDEKKSLNYVLKPHKNNFLTLNINYSK